ncbi:MAG: hypothetical protein GY714_26405 [Desulfobacterales bacterium]|nr:hypothetical protein [Desulfobacterales bacterium]
MLNFKKCYIYAVFIVLVFSVNNTFAGGWDKEIYEYMENPIEATNRIVSNAITDSYSPFSFFKEGDATFTLNGSYFDVEILGKIDGGESDGNDVEGRDLSGRVLSFTFNYAVTDRFYMFGIYTNLEMDGQSYEDLNIGQDVLMDIEATDYHYSIGLGYEFFKGESFSMPVSLGFIYKQYDYEIYSRNDSVTNIAKGDAYAMSVIFALSYKASAIDLKFTPYIYTQFGTPIEMTLYDSNNNVVNSGEEPTFDLMYIPGMKVEYLGFDNFSLSIGLSGLMSNLDFYGDQFLKGLQLKTVLVGITYSF